MPNVDAVEIDACIARKPIAQEAKDVLDVHDVCRVAVDWAGEPALRGAVLTDGGEAIVPPVTALPPLSIEDERRVNWVWAASAREAAIQKIVPAKDAVGKLRRREGFSGLPRTAAWLR